jgi:prophage regulatory protein
MKILRTPEVLSLTGLSRATIWRKEREGTFPARIKLGENSVGYKSDEIFSWIESRPRSITHETVQGGESQ